MTSLVKIQTLCGDYAATDLPDSPENGTQSGALLSETKAGYDNSEPPIRRRPVPLKATLWDVSEDGTCPSTHPSLPPSREKEQDERKCVALPVRQ